MAFNYFDRLPHVPTVGNPTNPAAGSVLPLDSAYSYGSVGDCLALGFLAAWDTTLSKVHFWIDAVTIDSNGVVIELREQGAASDQSVGALVANGSMTYDPGGAAGWHTATFPTPPILAIGSAYYVCLGNIGSSPTSNYPSLTKTNGMKYNPDGTDGFFCVNITTDGWQTATRTKNMAPCIVAEFANGEAVGTPYSNRGDSSGAGTRGLLLKFNRPVAISGVRWASPDALVTKVEVFQEGQLPTDTPLRSVTLGTRLTEYGLCRFERLTLTANVAYRIVLTVGAGTALPQYSEIEGNPAALVRACGYGGGQWYFTEKDGGAWSDDIDKFPLMDVLIDGFPNGFSPIEPFVRI